MRPETRALQNLRNWDKSVLGYTYTLTSEDETIGGYQIMEMERGSNQWVTIYRASGKSSISGTRLFVGPLGDDFRRADNAPTYSSPEEAIQGAAEHASMQLKNYEQSFRYKKKMEKPKSRWEGLLEGLGLSASELEQTNPALALRLDKLARHGFLMTLAHDQ